MKLLLTFGLTLFLAYQGADALRHFQLPEQPLEATLADYARLNPSSRKLFALRLQSALDADGRPVPNRCRGDLHNRLDRALAAQPPSTRVAAYIYRECTL